MSSIIEVVALALQRQSDNRYMIARRGPGQSGSGDWEFPGGKIEFGETQKDALVREIAEEFSFTLFKDSLQFVDENTFAYPSRTVKLHLWLSRINSVPDFNLSDHDQIIWCTPQEMKNYKISPADIYFIDKLL